MTANSTSTAVITGKCLRLCHAIDLMRRHLVNLVNAINCANYESAWAQACEVIRSMERAELLINAYTRRNEQRWAFASFDALRSVVMRTLMHAPSPSALAIAQIRSKIRRQDWAWAYEEEKWQAQRAAADPLLLASDCGTLVLQCGGSSYFQ